MRLVKRLTKNPVTIAVICWLVACYIRLVQWTTRRTFRGFEPLRDMCSRGEPFIGAFWHGRMVLMPGMWRRLAVGRKADMLTSHHQDGQMISRVIAHFGIGTISGSTSRGGAAALRAMLRSIKAGKMVGITPDGPRGPRMRASIGVAVAASIAGVPVLPFSYAASRHRLFKSWDRFMLPLPFGRAVFVLKDPIEVPRNADPETMEAARKRIEEALNEATREAEEACGMVPVEPAPAPQPATAGSPAQQQ